MLPSRILEDIAVGLSMPKVEIC